MQMTEFPTHRLDLPRPAILSAVRKFVPYLRRAATLDDPCADLERLALSSSHLLPDLGFEEDRTASGTQQKVWRRGAYVVTVGPATDPCGAPKVDVRRAPGRGAR